MPKVGGKKYPYDKEGMKKAKKAKRKMKRVEREVSKTPLLKGLKRGMRKK